MHPLPQHQFVVVNLPHFQLHCKWCFLCLAVNGSSTVLSTSSTYSPSPSSTTTYQLTVTKNGCSNTDNVTVTVGTEITGAGSINGAESQCTSYNPGNIVNSLSAQGGSGGTLTYFWEVSTTSNSTGFTTISGATLHLTTRHQQ